MKYYLTLFIACLFFSTSFGQEVISSSEYLLHKNDGARVNFAGANLDQNANTVNLYSVTYVKNENDGKFYRQLNTLKFDAQTLSHTDTETKQKSVNQALLSAHNQTNDLIEIIPYSDEDPFSIKAAWKSFSIRTIEDGEPQLYTAEKPEVTGKLVSFDEYVLDKDRKQVISVFGDRKKGKEFKWNEYKDLQFATYDGKGKLKNTVAIKFQYPRTPIFSSVVAKPNKVSNDQLSFDKAVYVLGKVTGLGKNNNPDKTAYNIVCLDASGDKVFEHTFSAGNEKHQLKPAYVYDHNGKVAMFAKLEGKDAAYVHMLFDNTGLVSSKMYSAQDLSTDGKTTVINGNVGAKQPLLATTYGKYIDIDYHHVAEDGSVLLVGNAYEEVTKTIAANPEAGIPGGTTTTNKIQSFNVLNFDGDLNFKDQLAVSSDQEINATQLGSDLLALNIGSNPKLDFNIGDVVLEEKAANGSDIKLSVSYEAQSKSNSTPLVLKLGSDISFYHFGSVNLFNINNRRNCMITKEGDIIIVGVIGKPGTIIQNTNKWPIEAKLVRVSF